MRGIEAFLEIVAIIFIVAVAAVSSAMLIGGWFGFAILAAQAVVGS